MSKIGEKNENERCLHKHPYRNETVTIASMLLKNEIIVFPNLLAFSATKLNTSFSLPDILIYAIKLKYFNSLTQN